MFPFSILDFGQFTLRVTCYRLGRKFAWIVISVPTCELVGQTQACQVIVHSYTVIVRRFGHYAAKT